MHFFKITVYILFYLYDINLLKYDEFKFKICFTYRISFRLAKYILTIVSLRTIIGKGTNDIFLRNKIINDN